MLVASKSYFATRLEELRQRAELTVYALAKQSGVSKQAIAKLESGANAPAWETVLKLAKALGVEVTEFVSPDPAVTPAPEEPDQPATPAPRAMGKFK